MLGAAAECRLEFASKILRIRVAEQELRERVCVGSHIERFVLTDTCEGATGDVAHRVAAGLTGRDADRSQAAHQRGSVINVNVVQLEILARRDMGNPIRIFFRQFGHHLQLLRIHSPVWDLNPLHSRRVPDGVRPFGRKLRRKRELLGLATVIPLAIVVALAINPPAQASFRENLFVNLVLSPQFDFLLEGLNLFG